MGKRITYLLGAGASYRACPILNEQADKMILMAVDNLDDKTARDFQIEKPRNLTERDDILWDMGYFGTKAKKFGTIDTYAKKLHVSNDIKDRNELPRLKLAVSIFFTLWMKYDSPVKKRNVKTKEGIDEVLPFADVDPRYISLLAAILEKNKTGNPKLRENVRFVNWNYDLQVEKAYKAFCSGNQDWDTISESISFRVNDKTTPLEVCHLNGYHGFYYLNNTQEEKNVLDREDFKNITDILKEIGFTSTSASRGQLRFTDHINYAWETNTNAITARTQAEKIFSETDIVVVIGYSFPSFNKEIDSALFSKLQGRKTKIIYQDPNASEDFLKVLSADLDCEYSIINDRLDSFYLPYEF